MARKGSVVQNLISGRKAMVTSNGFYTNCYGFVRLGVVLSNGQYRQWSYKNILEL